VSKSLKAGTEEELKFIVVEGSSENHSTVNKTVGCITISGRELKRDLLRGMDIDLTFELSESRELAVRAYVTSTDQEFSRLFTTTEREVHVGHLVEEVLLLEARLEQDFVTAKADESYEFADKLKPLRDPMKELRSEALLLEESDGTDDRYKLEDRKRSLAQKLHQVTAPLRLEGLRAEYMDAKESVTDLVNQSGNDLERRQLEEIVRREAAFLNSPTLRKVQTEIDNLYSISSQILLRTPSFLVDWFEELSGRRERFNDQIQAQNLIEAGKRHIAAEDYDRLAEVNLRLRSLLPRREQGQEEKLHFTRITRST
jgi:molecular chaperone DnaK